MSNRLTKTFDWKFFVALSFTAMVAFALAGSLHTWKQDAAKDARIGVLISSINEQSRATESARTSAAEEREHLLRNQARLLNQWRKLDARQQRILRYLRAQGIELPSTLGNDFAQRADENNPPSSPSAPEAGEPAGAGQGGAGGAPSSGDAGGGGGGGGPGSPAPVLPPMLPPTPSPSIPLLGPDVLATPPRTRAQH